MENIIRAIIVDDEKNGREVLKSLLDKFIPEVLVIGMASNVDEAYDLVNKLHPQLLFLDIQMPGGSGFTLLKRWDELPFDFIFVTSFDEYAINAIRSSALDYLLKPLKVDDLRFAVGKALNSIKEKTSKQQQIVALLDNIDSAANEKRVAVHIRDKVKLLNVNHILYVFADEGCCTIKMITGENYTTTRYLKDFAEMLSDNHDFLYIHKGCIINIIHIKEYSKMEPCIIEMIDGRQFEVSRRKKQEVLERLKSKG